MFSRTGTYQDRQLLWLVLEKLLLRGIVKEGDNSLWKADKGKKKLVIVQHRCLVAVNIYI